MNIEIKIKEIRESKRIRQVEVADALNMDNSQYAKIEKRGKKLSIEQIEKIAGALEVSVAELLGFEITLNNTNEVKETEKDKEIAELKKRISELEKVNNLLEGNAYAIESISRKLINGFIEISFESAKSYYSKKYSNPGFTFISEEDKYDNYRKANEKYQNESKEAIKDLVSQGYFKIILKKMLFEHKDKLKIILRWILMDKYTTENLTLDFDELQKIVEGIESHSTEDVINEAVDTLFIPFFSGMGLDKHKSAEKNDKI